MKNLRGVGASIFRHGGSARAVHARRSARWFAAILTVVVLTGCATIKDQVEQDIKLADACEDIQSNQAGYVETSKEAYLDLIQHRVLGDVVSCGIGNSPPSIQSVLYCGINDDLAKNLALQSAVFASFKGRFHLQQSAINTSLDNIKSSLNVMRNGWNNMNRVCKTVGDCTVEYATFMLKDEIRMAASDIEIEQNKIATAVDNIQLLANEVEVAVTEAGQQDQILLLADTKRFVVNTKAFLGTSRRALAGDIAMITRDAVINNLYFQLSHRILDSLDNSLSRAERMLDKADDKLYGVFSIGMVVGRTSIQKRFDSAVTSMVCKASRGQPPERAAVALAQAACERVAAPNRTAKSYLAPLLEASFVKAVHYARKASEQERSVFWQKPKDGRSLLQEECLANMEADTAEKQPLLEVSTNGKHSSDARPFKIYMAHEWAVGMALTSVAPQEMTRSQIRAADSAAAETRKKAEKAAAVISIGSLHPLAAAAALESAGKIDDHPGKNLEPAAPDPLPRTRLVATLAPREAIKQLALSSSSAAISEFQAGHNGDDYRGLDAKFTNASSVKNIAMTFVTTQNQSVSVNMTANAVQNVNVAPATPAAPAAPNIIVVPVPTPANDTTDLCSTLSEQFKCIRRANGSYEIVASRFAAGAYQDSALEDMLVGVGRASSRTGRGFDAVITGTASTAEFSCQQVAGWRIPLGSDQLFRGARIGHTGAKSYQMVYRNRRVGCDSKHKLEGNHFLSFARAAWASNVLEESPGANIRTVDVLGVGATYAQRSDSPDDRNVTIRLFPR